MEEKHYEIRSDYRINTEIHTIDTSTNTYWTGERIKRAALYQWHVYTWARDLVEERGLSVVVDVGCGPAVKLNELIAPCASEIFGIDQPSIVEFCKRTYSKGTYLADDFESPSVELPREPDLIICCDVIEHLLSPDALVGYLKRLAGTDTLILISTPDRDRLRGPDATECPNPAHIREWSSPEFHRYLASSGLEVLEQRHSPPLRTTPSRLFLRHFMRQLRPGRSWQCNNAVLCRCAP